LKTRGQIVETTSRRNVMGNYDDYEDFHGLQGCQFSDAVRCLPFHGVGTGCDPVPPKILDKVSEAIKNSKANIPNTAAKIAMEIIPL
jgi:hypothetical protein